MIALLMIVGLLLLLPLTLLALLPFGFALVNIRNLFTLPGQMVAVAFDKRRRRNHSLEHATVNVLEERFGARLPMGGFAERDGFHIHGPAHPDMVLDAAREGLERLQAGETALALHPRCGTIIVSGQLISAITFVAALLLMRGITFFSLLLAMFIAILAARALAQPLGMLLQRTLTTTTDVSGLHVDRLDAKLPEHPLALMMSGGQPTEFRIWTNDVQVEPVTQGPKRWKAY